MHAYLCMCALVWLGESVFVCVCPHTMRVQVLLSNGVWIAGPGLGMYVSYGFITDGQPALLALRGVARCACVFGCACVFWRGVARGMGREKCVPASVCVCACVSVCPLRVSVLARVDPRPAWHVSAAPLQNQAPCPSSPRPSSTTKASAPRDTSVPRHTHVAEHGCPSSPRPRPPAHRVVLRSFKSPGAVAGQKKKHATACWTPWQ